jgi:hypothetical protein
LASQRGDLKREQDPSSADRGAGHGGGDRADRYGAHLRRRWLADDPGRGRGRSDRDAENPDAGALPDPTGDAAFDPTTNGANACLDRIVRPGGWLDLCWQVSRLMNDSDPAQDYYLLRVWGTLHGNPAPSGLRWAVIRAVPDPASSPINYRLEWPGPTVYDGGCQDTTADTGGPFPEEATTVCGRTTGLTSTSQADATGLVWTCAGCFLPMSTDQGVLMTYGTAVLEGGTPIWDVNADIGS